MSPVVASLLEANAAVAIGLKAMAASVAEAPPDTVELVNGLIFAFDLIAADLLSRKAADVGLPMVAGYAP